jgi:hypothetical protein
MSRPKYPTKFVKFQRIAVDELNPRQAPQEGQREAIRTLVHEQRDKILNLASDVNEDGLSQGERFMVIESGDARMPYISIDGNRRLVALKILEDTSLVDGVLSAGYMRTLKKQAEIFSKNPISEVEIVIYPDRETGAPWVARRHSAGLGGRGQDGWGTEEKIRFDAWRNEDDGTPEYQLLQFVRSHASLTTAEQTQFTKFPLTTLRRVITTEYAKKKFGYEITEGKIVTSHTDDEFIKPFKRLFLELTNPDRKQRLKVDQLKTNKLQEEYFDKYPEADLPSATAPAAVPHKVGDTVQLVVAPTKPAAKKPTKSKNGKQTTSERLQTIPKDCQLTITEQRILDIYDELQNKLIANTTRNACAVLLRVFIELSADDFLNRYPTIPVTSKGTRLDATLGDKLWAIATYAKDNNLLTQEQAEVVKEGTAKENFLAPRVRSMHTYVHTANTPLIGDLQAHWNNVEPLMKVIWA